MRYLPMEKCEVLTHIAARTNQEHNGWDRETRPQAAFHLAVMSRIGSPRDSNQIEGTLGAGSGQWLLPGVGILVEGGWKCFERVTVMVVQTTFQFLKFVKELFVSAIKCSRGKWGNTEFSAWAKVSFSKTRTHNVLSRSEFFSKYIIVRS